MGGVGPVVGFDLDMTLVDSAAGIVATLRAALAEVGVDVEPAAIWPVLGIPLAAMIDEVAPQVDVPAAVRRYRELYPALGVGATTLLPGAAEAVDAVQAAGGRVLVVSAKTAAAVHAVLARTGLDGPDRRPDLVVGDRFAAEKGMVLAEHGADAYVGDHPGDVEAARTAGAVAVGVATGPHGRADLEIAGADVVLSDLTGFVAWFDAWCAGSEGGWREPLAER